MALFSGELNELKVVHNVLKAINFKEFATVRIMEEGLKITIEEMKSVQTSAYIPKEVFTNYKINCEDDVIEFKIGIKVFTECLNIFGDEGSASMKIMYRQIGSPLYLVLIHTEENVTADCEIKTMEADDLAELSLQDECCLNNIVVNSSQLAAILSDLDTSAEIFELLTSDQPPYFKISTTGTQSECHVEVPKTSEMIVLFRCSGTTRNKYIFSYIKQIIKVIGLSAKVSISTGEQGLLGMQMIITTEGDKQMYVEYYVNALLD